MTEIQQVELARLADRFGELKLDVSRLIAEIDRDHLNCDEEEEPSEEYIDQPGSAFGRGSEREAR